MITRFPQQIALCFSAGATPARQGLKIITSGHKDLRYAQKNNSLAAPANPGPGISSDLLSFYTFDLLLRNPSPSSASINFHLAWDFFVWCTDFRIMKICSRRHKDDLIPFK
jgi:hypothetical protein